MIIEGPRRTALPRRYVLAWMASLSMASGVSAQCYVDELVAELAMRRAVNNGGDA